LIFDPGSAVLYRLVMRWSARSGGRLAGTDPARQRTHLASQTLPFVSRRRPASYPEWRIWTDRPAAAFGGRGHKRRSGL